jgi:putative hemolysin
MVEVGRSCIDSDYRTGTAIALLWSGLARYMLRNGHDYLIGYGPRYTGLHSR